MRIPLFLLLTLLTATLAGCTTTPGSGGAGAGADSCDEATRAGLELENETHTVVALATSEGCILAELYDDKVPITVANFLGYVEDGFYTDMLIHRISVNFMVQTGGMMKSGEFKEGTQPMIRNEARESGLQNLEYTLSMARMGRNPDGTGDGADTATNQFFINTADNGFLDASSRSAGYAVFGNVVSGHAVVDAIEATPTDVYDPARKCQPEGTAKTCPLEDVDLFSIRVVS